MSTNPDHIDNLAWIIREVDEDNQFWGIGLTAPQLAEAILNHPASLWQLPDNLAQPEVGNCARIELVGALHSLASQFENETAAFTGDDLEAVQGHVKHARKVAAMHNQNGPGCAPPALPANYIDPEHQGEALELLQTFYQACNAEGGTADEIHLRGIHAVLAARPTTPPAQGPAPDSPAEALTARRLLQEVARLDKSVGIIVAEVRQLAAHAAAWLRENPPGQTVAIEPRGCPTPGACSCVVPVAPPAPEVGEVDDLVAWLTMLRDNSTGIATRYDERLARIVALLQQLPAPAPAVVPVAVTDDRDPECVARWPECVPDGYDPRCCRFPKSCSCAHAIPLPQAGEVPHV
jgi:hypothetical protein